MSSKEPLWTITIENFVDYFNPKIKGFHFDLSSYVSRFQEPWISEARYIQVLRTWQVFGTPRCLESSAEPKFTISLFLSGLSWLLTTKNWPQMCPLTLKLNFKVARCVGDHVDVSNSAGSSDSAEESFILLNQMVLTGCVPCTLNMPI